MKTKINEETVKYLAHLSRIELTKEEISEFTYQLDTILKYMDQLNELNTDGIEPTSHAIELKLSLREDQRGPSLAQEETMMNAPQRMGPFFKVPPVIETEA
ncbi:MAG: Asp-tRNA(Asn)/Glu-tRNA(Gln) amidotransferase subunit GatC [Desulfobacterota bacterium]|nr:Asp-tRNA(Asn)/Glu-tRNA(Gln) amidotransferase subunit GatC [Thermodesulfobacteriota bacterium]MDW8001983.1 Asp-tRNA(Asn)/Glu-tRNA(Gln) amidotransferase subunit GatC [Deltaproteobacteria bacterium]